MSSIAMRPCRLAGSTNAPSFSSLRGTLDVWKSPVEPITSPGVPFWIRLLATSTVIGSLAELTLCLYRLRKTSSRIAASSAAPIPTAIVPRRVERTLFDRMCSTELSSSSLLGHDRDTPAERAEVAELGAGVRVEVVDVLD